MKFGSGISINFLNSSDHLSSSQITQRHNVYSEFSVQFLDHLFVELCMFKNKLRSSLSPSRKWIIWKNQEDWKLLGNVFFLPTKKIRKFLKTFYCCPLSEISFCLNTDFSSAVINYFFNFCIIYFKK